MSVLAKDKETATDKLLKDLFARSENIDEENDEKLKNLILRTETNEKGEIINYIPESFAKNDKVANLKLKKQDKKNEKELDIQTSKIRDLEISSKKNESSLEIKLEENNGIKTEKIPAHYLSSKEIDDNKEDERQKEQKKEKGRNSILNLDNKKAGSKNEKELDIQTNLEREKGGKQINERKDTEKTIQETIKNKEKEKSETEKTIESIREIINETEKTKAKEKEFSSGFKKENSKPSTFYRWEFNGILTVIDNNGDKTMLFNRSGIENSYEKAMGKLSEAKTNFSKIIEKSKNNDYNMIIKDLTRNKILFYKDSANKHNIGQKSNSKQTKLKNNNFLGKVSIPSSNSK